MPKNSLVSETSITPRFEKKFLRNALMSIFHADLDEVDFYPLRGDASTRHYFRVSMSRHKKTGNPGSLILMQLEEQAGEDETDFTLILKFLKGLDLPVPKLFHYDIERGLIFLEDCGDTTLEDHLRETDNKQKTQYYRQAVELLAQMQFRATRDIGPDCPAYHLKFDVEKLMWEYDFMVEHYLGGLKKTPLEKPELSEIRQSFLPVCETLSAQKTCFTHRDYHSRNLMVCQGDLKILDFQDARMGPCQYDLASLLKDSYLQLDDKLVTELIDYFIQLKEEEEKQPVDREEFMNIFDLMSVQRNLKAVGTFAYQSVARKNDRYLEYITPTLDYVRRTLARHPELQTLRSALSKHIPELDS